MHFFPGIRWDQVGDLPFGLFEMLMDFVDQHTSEDEEE